MQALEQCELITNRLLEVLQEESHIERERLIEKVEKLLHEKDAVLSHIHPPFSSQEQIIGKRLADKSTLVNVLLEQIRQEIVTDMKQLQTNKKSVTNYTNPYRNVGQANSYFYDKRK